MHPDPLFTVFGQGVYLYGICFALGVIACFAFLIFTMWYKNFSETSSSAILFIGIFATAFGALSGMADQGYLARQRHSRCRSYPAGAGHYCRNIFGFRSLAACSGNLSADKPMHFAARNLV